MRGCGGWKRGEAGRPEGGRADSRKSNTNLGGRRLGYVMGCTARYYVLGRSYKNGRIDDNLFRFKDP